MNERDYRLDELLDRVANLESLENERAHLTDVEPEKESWLAENLRMLSVIGSLGPGELGLGQDSPTRDWGPLRVVGVLREDDLFLAQEGEKTCWLRLLPPARTRPTRGRGDLEREAAILVDIDTPGLARVRGAGAFEGRTGIWAEASEGKWLDASDALPWPEACDLAIAMARMVGRLHEHGLIQRRLTRDRILLRPEGPLLVDLGSDEDGPVAPEVARGAAPTVRSDVWALGCLLFEAAGIEPDSRECDLVHDEPAHRPATMDAAIASITAMRDRRPDRPQANGWRRFFRRQR